jgi:predicted ABC-type ATPase
MARRRGRIVVAAGTNGAGKSAIVGEFLSENGGAYFNPDELAKQLVARGMSADEANSVAWNTGFDGLRRAIDSNQDFNFETTLGGSSIVRDLQRAIAAGRSVCVIYVGLASPELHIARVRARVARGGHPIPESKIRERYPQSLANLVSLIGKAEEIHVFDNSAENASGAPASRLAFRMHGRRIVEPDVETLFSEAPDWAKPLVAAAMRCQGGRGPVRGTDSTRRRKK